MDEYTRAKEAEIERGGGGVFPRHINSYGGLTKRELIATEAMAGLLAGRGGKHLQIESEHVQMDASIAVLYADALLAELAK